MQSQHPLARQGPWEVDLTDFLRASETWDQKNDRKKAQEFADKLNEVRQFERFRYQVL